MVLLPMFNVTLGIVVVPRRAVWRCNCRSEKDETQYIENIVANKRDSLKSPNPRFKLEGFWMVTKPKFSKSLRYPKA